MTRYAKDFSTGDVSQYTTVISSGPVGQATGDYFRSTEDNPDGLGDHTIQVIPNDDPDAGYVCRFELKDGDSFEYGGDSDWGVGTQKAELAVYPPIFYVGSTWWMAWSIKFVQFDQWDNTRGNANFLIFDEWHSQSQHPAPSGGATIFWGMPPWASGRLNGQNRGPGTPYGYYSLIVDQYAEGGEDINDHQSRTTLLNVPIVIGQWIDIKMQVKWSPEGFIRCWINGQLQTLLSGGTTWNGQTTLGETPDPEVVVERYYFQPGIYRSGDGAPYFPWNDMVIHHANFRAAENETEL